MIKLIELFFLVLSTLYFLKNVAIFVFKITTEDNPEPVELSTTEQVFIYLSISYIITFVLGSIIGII
jgi:hypothetical protein